VQRYTKSNEAFHINKRAVNYFLDFSLLCRPIWGNVTVSAFPHFLIVGRWGNGVPPTKYLGGTVFPRITLHYTTVHPLPTPPFLSLCPPFRLSSPLVHQLLHYPLHHSTVQAMSLFKGERKFRSQSPGSVKICGKGGVARVMRHPNFLGSK